MRTITNIAFLFWLSIFWGQESFSGYIDTSNYQGDVYLSVVDDYRKINGVYSEQVLAKTTVDSTGYFQFKNLLLESKNKIYRIHVDNCAQPDENAHVNGYCNGNKSIVFIANNTDQIELPFSFDNEMFCSINSTNEKSSVFVKIDSLKADMKFAYTDIRSEVGRNLNNKTWFKTLQDFGQQLEEPLAELYIYAFLSDRTNEFHNYYVKDLRDNSYYDELKIRLEQHYPNTRLTRQYVNEIAADRYMLSVSNDNNTTLNWTKILIVLLSLSILINAFLVFKFLKRKRNRASNLKNLLSKQELVVLEHLLQNKSNKDIAEALFLSVSTIKSHTNNIYKKLNVQSREEVNTLFSR